MLDLKKLFQHTFFKTTVVSIVYLHAEESITFCRWFCMCVCLSRCSFKSILLFVSRWNRAIFGRYLSMWHSTNRRSSIFDLGPLTPKIYSPKFATAQNRL